MSSVFLHCRAGFEGECAAEIQERAALLGISGYCKAKPGSAYVIYIPHEAGAAGRLHQILPFTDLVFARQWFVVLGLRTGLPPDDRVTGLLEVLRGMPGGAGDLFIETPDTNESKQLSALCRGIAAPLRDALVREDLYRAGEGGLRAHVCFMSTHAAYAGYALDSNSAPWPMGIPRLRFPRHAPSRSTLKLEEALLYFLTDDQRRDYLRPGMRAVDLGASPGGWTWQLAQRQMQVTAVDNGAMAEAVMATGLVEHARVDGFRYSPAGPVDWMVCDIVEQPIRIADLAARWMENGWCRHAIFNLKLPMKKRWQELKLCLELIEQRLQAAGMDYMLRARQLYHDREEVTVYLSVNY